MSEHDWRNRMHKIFYDAECPICVREIELIMQDSRAGFMEAVPIQGSEAVLAQWCWWCI